jgi:hypothetical protein
MSEKSLEISQALTELIYLPSQLSASKHQVKIFELEVDEDDNDEEMEEADSNELEEEQTPSSQVMAVPRNPANGYNNSNNSKMYVKQMSSSSSVLSAGSSTAATVGSANTTFRGKRKKDFEDEEDEDVNTCASEYEGESVCNDVQSVSGSVAGGVKLNLTGGNVLGGINIVGESLEIGANQNNNQQIHPDNIIDPSLQHHQNI